jgi:hypothetical protein
MRIFGDALPAVLGAATYLLARGYGIAGSPGAGFVRPGFITATAGYALASSVFVLLWPGGMARYYVPAVLQLCVLGGLGYDLFSTRLPLVIAPLLLLTAGILAYALLYSFGVTA